MFDKLFSYIRNGVKEAILGGFQDAHEELSRLSETGEPIAIEDKTNDKTATRRKASR